ncbi:MAG: methylated-DNA--[protein]-cysteine S-methyltransferase, partial [Erysipelotrichaceae bacterium]
IFKETERWLDMYFVGQQPDFDLKYKISNLTSFRKEVLDIALKIPYGKTSSYGDIAKKIAERHKIDKMSAQAVGSAIGFNPISIIIPCHRVVGSDGSISGYGGGIDNKIELLKLEKVIVDDDSYVVKY